MDIPSITMFNSRKNEAKTFISHLINVLLGIEYTMYTHITLF
jgi:hypothetical protein